MISPFADSGALGVDALGVKRSGEVPAMATTMPPALYGIM